MSHLTAEELAAVLTALRRSEPPVDQYERWRRHRLAATATHRPAPTDVLAAR